MTAFSLLWSSFVLGELTNTIKIKGKSKQNTYCKVGTQLVLFKNNVILYLKISGNRLLKVTKQYECFGKLKKLKIIRIY